MQTQSYTQQTASEQVQALFDQLTVHDYTLAVAESLTGGMVTAAITAVPGASDFLVGGITVYQTQQKAKQLGVNQQRLDEKGPVDTVVAEEMALGVAKLFSADCAIATTGVAGPGEADGHPAGTVIISTFTPNSSRTEKYQFTGDRAQVRTYTVIAALNQLVELLKQ